MARMGHWIRGDEGKTMTTTLNSVSELAYRFRQSRIAGVAFAVLLVICIGLIALARADLGESALILPFNKDSSVVSRLNTYVRTTGTLMVDQPFVAQTEVAGVTLSGSRFLPLMIEGAPDPLYVAEGSFPAPDANGQVTLRRAHRDRVGRATELLPATR